MKKLLFISLLFASCSPQHFTTAKTFRKESGWHSDGNSFSAPDTLTTIHKYEYKNNKVVKVLDLKLNDAGKWVPIGTWYDAPENLKTINGFVKNK